MKLGSIRTFQELRPVLGDHESFGPDPMYWVFSEVSQEWANVTIIAPGRISPASDGGQAEYPKTFGHYHPDNAEVEIYEVLAGEGVLVLQKKHLENGLIMEDIVDEVVLIKVKAGDRMKITPEWGHSWSNISSEPLITHDNWVWGHSPSDYQPIEKMHGMAYYLVEEGREVKTVANPNYMDLPKPKWVNASDLVSKFTSEE